VNTLSFSEVMRYKFKILDYLVPLNKLLREAYNAGVKDINVETQQNHHITGPAPIVFVSCYKKPRDL